MSIAEFIDVGLDNSSGELFVVKRRGKYYLMLTDHDEYKHVPVSKKTYETLKNEFAHDRLAVCQK